MKTTFSQIVFVVSCVVALLTAVATFWWISGLLIHAHPQTVAEEEAHETAGWNLIGFIYLVAPVLGGIALLCMIPSSIFFCRWRQRRDLWSLCLSGGSLLSLITEVIAIIRL